MDKYFRIKPELTVHEQWHHRVGRLVNWFHEEAETCQLEVDGQVLCVYKRDVEEI